MIFSNQDVAGTSHDVTADQNGPDGKPLFKSALIPGGKQAVVEGTQYLTTGDYAFHCSIHNFMQGTLHVTSAGTPAQRPGSLRASASFLDSRLRPVLRRGAFRVRFRANQQASFTFRVRARRVVVARGRGSLRSAGRSTARVRLTPRGRRTLRGRSRIRLTLSATAVDARGNRRSSSQTKTFRR